jgi:hypothetical protein
VYFSSTVELGLQSSRNLILLDADGAVAVYATSHQTDFRGFETGTYYKQSFRQWICTKLKIYFRISDSWPTVYFSLIKWARYPLFSVVRSASRIDEINNIRVLRGRCYDECEQVLVQAHCGIGF